MPFSSWLSVVIFSCTPLVGDADITSTPGVFVSAAAGMVPIVAVNIVMISKLTSNFFISFPPFCLESVPNVTIYY